MLLQIQLCFILSIPYTEWENMGFSKGTLHYMKNNAQADKLFTLNSHVRERLEMWEKINAIFNGNSHLPLVRN
jgi:hypothetical protein